MARIMAFDYGKRRTGIAVTDELQIIATGLAGVDTSGLMEFVADYLKQETVECFVLGYPTDLNGNPTHSTAAVEAFQKQLKKKWPAIPVKLVDERFTSRDATRALIASGIRKKARRNKKLLDEVSATIILQDYLQSQEQA